MNIMSLGEKAERDARAKRTAGLPMPQPKSLTRKENGKYFCENEHCSKWTKDGCLLRKVGLTCDNGECKYNVSPILGVYQCGCMDVHLDADGKCMGKENICK